MRRGFNFTIQTLGGTVSDYELADNMGFSSLLDNLNYYDLIAFHVVGIDHSGHWSGSVNEILIN